MTLGYLISFLSHPKEHIKVPTYSYRTSTATSLAYGVRDVGVAHDRHPPTRTQSIPPSRAYTYSDATHQPLKQST